jgi:hypothetical protein
MSTLTDILGSQITNVGKLIGLLTPAGDLNKDWFSSAGTELEAIPNRLPELLTLFDGFLGPAAEGANTVFPDAQWYPMRNPLDGIPTGIYLVTPKPSPSITTADIGVGVLHSLGYEELTFKAYAYVPLFRLSSSANPSFILDTQPAHIGLSARSGNKFTAPKNITFETLTLDVDIYFADRLPCMNLVFGGLTGQAVDKPSTYSSLGDLLKNEDVGEWVASIILQGTYWLSNYVGRSVYTIGDVLTAAGILTLDKDEKYQLNLAYLRQNVGNPKLLAENFLFNFLNTLADSSTPLIPISVGAEGSGIYIVKDAAADGSTNLGARLMIQEIALGPSSDQKEGDEGKQGKQNGKSKSQPELLIQLGKWIGGEEDSDSWVARSLGLNSGYPQPGISLNLLHRDSANSVTFAPRVELISLGLDVTGGADQPLFNIGGYTMKGAELRAYLKQQDKGFSFGAAVRLDGLGLPLGPGFGQAAEGSHTNPVAQSLLQSGRTAGDQTQPGSNNDPVNPTFSVSVAHVKGGHFIGQIYDKNGKPTRSVMTPVQRALGPLQCERLGLGWMQDTGDSSKDRLSLLFDGGIHLAGLDVDLVGLSVGIPVTAPGDFSKYDLDLDGLGLTLSSGQVEMSAALVKLGPDPEATPPRNYTQYNGEALLKGGTFVINALGSYAYVPDQASGKGYASLFIFGVLNKELGGPSFFYVTGVAAAFGYNRSLILPDQNSVPQFPLLVAASDPTSLGGTPPNPAKALVGLSKYVPPERGEYWLAAGVRFTSFDLVHSTALLVVEFGNHLEIALLGVSQISLPPPASPTAAIPAQKYAYAEMGLEVKLLPSEGVFSATAILTPNSFVIDPACKLTGGFAFCIWFGDNPHAGDFVVTIGGYHPDFKPPSYYPTVPRLGFNWPVSGNVTISGDAYFALTSSAVMAGAGLQVLYSSGDLKAWFNARMDALIEWAPFHYIIEISISIGVSYRLHLLFVTVTVKAELGADLTLWGPKMGGKAHVDWSVISFTVHFGADPRDKPQPLDWNNQDGTGFAQTLLPQKTEKASPAPHLVSVRRTPGQMPRRVAATGPSDAVHAVGALTITINDGLMTTFVNYEGETIWVVRPNHFVFSTLTTIPATEVDIKKDAATTRITPQDACNAGADYFVCIRPMKATLQSSVFTVELVDEDTNADYDLAGDFDFDKACNYVPAAKWGKPLAGGQDPEPNALLANRLLGLENIKPRQEILTPSGDQLLDIDVATAFTYDVVDGEVPFNPCHLPLSVQASAVAAVPSVDAGALDKIKSTLMSAAAVGARNSIYSALQRYGIDPVTNGSLDKLATDPGAVLTGNPMVATSSR